MTVIAPNLGRVFNGTARPATDEDIALLTAGDWIKEKDNPFCYKFKRWDFWNGEMAAIGTWEGKEFIVPLHMLMVVEILENQACEKFFRKPENRDLKETEISTDYSHLKVGDRLIHHSTNSKGIHTHFATVMLHEKGEITFKRDSGVWDTFSYKQMKEAGYSKYLQALTRESAKPGTYIIDQSESLAIITDDLDFGFVLDWLSFGKVPSPPSGKAVTYNWDRDDKTIAKFAITPPELVTKFLAQNDPQFKIGDKVEWTNAPKSIYQVVKPESGGHLTIELIEFDPLIKPKPPNRKRVALWEIQLLERPPCSPWSSPQEWLSAGVQCMYEDDLIFWGERQFKIQPKVKDKYLNPRVLVNFLEDSWNDLQCFVKYLEKHGESATEKEIIQHFGCKKSLFKNAIAFGLSLGILAKLKDEYKISSQPLVEPEKIFTSEIRVGDRFISQSNENHSFWRSLHGLHPIDPPFDSQDDRFIRCDTLTALEQIRLCQQRIKQQRWRIADLLRNCKIGKSRNNAIKDANEAIASEKQRIVFLLPLQVSENLRFAYRQLRQRGISHQEILKTLAC